ncbi:PP2C family protein-serine/threonine phosphatase [Bacillus salitolerans]|uniref:PP2C family protein-serine/threonine phosphatase n=1 Tax=Bacillus salitolerans TaxID=1437434 RepID=A0ABW4LS39_9BACI
MSVPILNELDKTLKREIKLAKNIQTKLLNSTPPISSGVEVSGISIPARLIGGDYYDVCKLPDGKLRMVIGDVMGKGIPAAMQMILIRGAFRSLAQKANDPSEMLTLINQALYEDLRSLTSFVTLFCADWDPASSTIRYANAGHAYPLLMTSSSTSTFLESKGIMIGGLPHYEYEQHELIIEKGSCLFFYTDGIIEAQNSEGELYNKKRLINLLSRIHTLPVEDIKNGVIEELHCFTEHLQQKDDITMLVFKYKY